MPDMSAVIDGEGELRSAQLDAVLVPYRCVTDCRLL